MKDLSITNDWANISDHFGYNPTKLFISNKSNSNLLINKQISQPDSDNYNGFILTEGGTPLSDVSLNNNSNIENIYARCVQHDSLSLVNIYDDSLKRNITTLSAAGGMYYLLSEPVVIGAGEDFEIELYGYVKQTVPANESLIGSIDSVNNFTIFQNSAVAGAVAVQFPQVGGGNLYATVNSVDEGVNTITLKRLGNTVTLSVGNKSSTMSNDNLLSEIIVNSVGKWNTLSFTGEIYDLKIWKNGDRNTGTLVVDMPIDENWIKSNVVYNKSTILGSNLVSNGDFSDGFSSWVDESGNGSATVVDSRLVLYYNTLQQIASQSISTNIGSKYLLEFDVNDLEGTYGFQVGTIIKASQNLTGRISVIFEATSAISKLQLKKGGIQNTSATFDNISIKEIPSEYPFATAINITKDESESFKLIDGGENWLGVELWNLPPYIFNGTEINDDIVQADSILLEGLHYRVTFTGQGDNIGTTGDSVSTRALIGNSSIFATQNPFRITEDKVALSTLARIQVRGTPPFSGTVSLESVKRIISIL